MNQLLSIKHLQCGQNFFALFQASFFTYLFAEYCQEGKNGGNFGTFPKCSNNLFKSDFGVFNMPKVKPKQDQSFDPQDDSEDEIINYSVIGFETRLMLIERIEKDGCSILKAARSLEIKPSTAKYIYKCYKNKGKILRKKETKDENENTTSQQNEKEVSNSEGQGSPSKPQKIINISQQIKQQDNNGEKKQKEKCQQQKSMEKRQFYHPFPFHHPEVIPIYTPYGYYYVPKQHAMRFPPPPQVWK